MEYLINGNINLGNHNMPDWMAHLVANGMFGAVSDYHRHLIANGLAPANPGLPDTPEYRRYKGKMKPLGERR